MLQKLLRITGKSGGRGSFPRPPTASIRVVSDFRKTLVTSCLLGSKLNSASNPYEPASSLPTVKKITKGSVARHIVYLSTRFTVTVSQHHTASDRSATYIVSTFQFPLSRRLSKVCHIKDETDERNLAEPCPDNSATYRLAVYSNGAQMSTDDTFGLMTSPHLLTIQSRYLSVSQNQIVGLPATPF